MRSPSLESIAKRRLVRAHHTGAGKTLRGGDQRRAEMLIYLTRCWPHAATLRELGKAVGLRSVGSVWFQVQNLVSAGLVESRGKLGVLVTAQGRCQGPTPEPVLLPLEWIL